MAPIEWKPEYSLGDPAIDHEHQEMIRLVNQALADLLEGRPGADLDRCLGDLYQTVSAHFALEEQQMRRAGYTDYHPHKDDHERLLDTLRDIMDETRPDETHLGDESAAARMTAALESWFSGHFRTHDRRLHGVLGPHAH